MPRKGQPSRRQTLSRTRPEIAFCVTALLSCIVWWGGTAFDRYQQEQLALKLVDRMTADNCRALLNQLNSLEPPAIEAMVLAATKADAKIARQARLVVDHELAKWRRQAGVDGRRELATQLQRLAAALATHVDRMGPLGQQWATQVALQLIELSNQFPPEESVEIVAHSNRVLTATPPQGPLQRKLPTMVRTWDEEAYDPPWDPVSPMELAGTPTELLEEFGNSNPLRHVPIEPHQEPVGGGLVAVPPTGEATPDRQSLPWMPTGIGNSSPVTSNGPQLSRVITPQASQLELAHEVREVPSPSEWEDLSQRLRSEPTDNLIQQLTEADFYTAGAIKHILRDRNVRDSELEIRTRLLADDPDERLHAIDHLDTLPARTVRLLLQRLLKDSDARIRRRALSALATSSDPALYDLAKEMALRDEDPAVNELASRILRQLR